MGQSILLYNPNTTAAMTQRMMPAARAAAGQGFEMVGQQASKGPESIEGYYDEALSVPPLLERFSALDQEGFSAAVIACFDDTGLDAARCITDIPVIGLCQASCITASQVAGSFAIVTTLSQSVPALEHLVARYGYGMACKAVLASDIPVLDLEQPGSNAEATLTQLCEQAISVYGAEALVLGCAGMVELAESLQKTLGVPIIEPVSAAVAQAAALANLGLQNSRAKGYRRPRPKAIT